MAGATTIFSPSEPRLPSGRHRLTREAVETSQRGRLLEAMVEVVAAKGYTPTTVADVVDRAGVSRRTFYEHFASKEACFLAAYDVGVEVLLNRMREVAGEQPEADWRARLRSELDTYTRLLAEEPAFAWSLHVEVLAAGPAALERRAQIFAMFTSRIRRLNEIARKQDPLLPKLHPQAFAFHSGGVDEIVRECLRTKGVNALPKVVDAAVASTEALFGARLG